MIFCSALSPCRSSCCCRMPPTTHCSQTHTMAALRTQREWFCDFQQIMAETATLCFIWLRPSYGLFYRCQPQYKFQAICFGDVRDIVIGGPGAGCRRLSELGVDQR